MSEVTRYRAPLPLVADHRDFDGDSCDATAENDAADLWPWNCTRAKGHEGRHEAGGPRGQMYASWPAEQRCPNCAPGYDCESGIYTPTDLAEAGPASAPTQEHHA